MPRSQGGRKPKLSERQVAVIRTMHASGEHTITALADTFKGHPADDLPRPGVTRPGPGRRAVSTVEVGVRLAFAPAGLVELGPSQPRAGIGRQR